MWMLPRNQAKDLLIILIEQVGRSSIQPDGSQSWSVQITSRNSHADSGKEVVHNSIQIDDFFGREQRADVSIYLNDLLRSKEWTSKQSKDAETVTKAIRQFGPQLLRSLQLSEWAVRRNLKDKDLEIEVCTESGFVKGSQGSSRSIQCLFWELLEHTNSWSEVLPADNTPRSVRVRRHVEKPRRHAMGEVGPRISFIERRMTPRVKGILQEFDILLVVARKSDPQKVDNLSSTIAQTAVVKMCMELVLDGSLQRVYTHVVRPGTFERLREILEQNPGRFKVVHFDMHGGVLSRDDGDAQSPSAFLQFNRRENNSLTDHLLTGGELSALADLLVASRVDCVVLGACQTAHADIYAHSNLSWVFVEKGIKNVLAMSHNMADTMSDIFFHKFYYELFIGGKEFSHSARLARKWLSTHPKRYYYEGKKWMELQDWFVPIVYSDGTLSRMVPDTCAFWSRNRLRLLYALANWLWFTFYCAHPALVWGCGRTLPVHMRDGNYIAYFLLLYYLTGLALAWTWKRYLSSRKLMIIASLEETHKDKRNILRLENDLCHSEMVFLYGRDEKKAQNLLRNLIILWEMTHMVRHTVILDATCFKTPSHWRLDAANRRIDSWKTDARDRKEARNPRMLVIVENVTSLYPEDVRPVDQDNQSHFETWLNETFVGDIKPFLIIIGRGTHTLTVPDHASKTKTWFVKNLGRCASLANTMTLTMFRDTNPKFLIPEEASHYPVSRMGDIAEK